MSKKIDEAVERIRVKMEAEAEPHSMSQEEAIEFYEGIVTEAEMWVQTIRDDMKRDAKDGEAGDE